MPAQRQLTGDASKSSRRRNGKAIAAIETMTKLTMKATIPTSVVKSGL